MTIVELLEYVKKYPVAGFRLIDENVEVFQARLYRDGAEVKSYDRSTVFLGSSSYVNNNCISYVQLADNVEPESVTDDIDAFIGGKIEENQNANSLKLFRYLNMGRFLDSLMDDAFKLLQNPIIYYDSLHNVVMHRESKDVSHRGWMREIEIGHHDFSRVEEWFYDDLQAVVKTRDILIRIFDGDHCAGASIVYNNNLFGFLGVLENNRILRPSDKKVIRYVADIIAIKSYTDNAYSENDDYTYTNLFRELLNGRIQSRQLLTGLLRSRKWKPKKYNRIYVITSNGGNSNAYISYLQKHIQNMRQNKVINYKENLIILVEKDNAEDSAVLDLPGIEHASLGISDVFDDLFDMNRYYQQAKKAIEYGSMLDREKRKYYYADYRFADLVSEIKSTKNFSSFIHPAALEISAYDLEHHSQYFITLLTYLTYAKSIEKSCAELGLHKNTVQYRINKIKELFRIDFENHEQLFTICLSLKMLYWSNRLT